MYAISSNPIQITRDGITFKLDNNEPSKFATEVGARDLRETPENVENGLKELRKLLKEEANLFCPLDNDLWLLSFLRPAHFYPEGAMKMIRGYFNCRAKYPHLCKNLTLEFMHDFMHDCNGSFLPQRDQCGRRIYVGLSGKYWNNKKFDKEMMMRTFVVQTAFARTESDTQICGIVIILDVNDLSFRQALHFSPGFLKSLVDCLQEGIALRLIGYHVVNNPKIADMLYLLAKPFIREKFQKRVFFHGSDWASLHRHIAPECLPECYGGTAKATKPSYDAEYYELFEKLKSDYDRSLTYGYIKDEKE